MLFVRVTGAVLLLGALLFLPYALLAGSRPAFAMLALVLMGAVILVAVLMMNAVHRRRPPQNRGASR